MYTYHMHPRTRLGKRSSASFYFCKIPIKKSEEHGLEIFHRFAKSAPEEYFWEAPGAAGHSQMWQAASPRSPEMQLRGCCSANICLFLHWSENAMKSGSFAVKCNSSIVNLRMGIGGCNLSTLYLQTIPEVRFLWWGITPAFRRTRNLHRKHIWDGLSWRKISSSAPSNEFDLSSEM